MSRKTISIISTAFNEEECISLFIDEVDKQVLKYSERFNFEFIICDNGSFDTTLELIRKKITDLKYIKCVQLSRNFGHQGGILACLSQVTGDAVIMLDADGQHPPEIFGKMIDEWESGSLIVNTKKIKSTFEVKNIFDMLFYKLMEKLTGMDLGQADFRLIDKKVFEQLIKFKENQKFIRGLVSWQGYKTSIVKYKVKKRIGGKSKFSFFKLIDFAFQGIASFSLKPLRLMISLGFLFLIPSILFLFHNIYIGIQYLYFNEFQEVPPGWATISVLVTFFGSIQLLSLGLLGEYIGKIYIEVKGRPNYIINEVLDYEKL